MACLRVPWNRRFVLHFQKTIIAQVANQLGDKQQAQKNRSLSSFSTSSAPPRPCHKYIQIVNGNIKLWPINDFARKPPPFQYSQTDWIRVINKNIWSAFVRSPVEWSTPFFLYKSSRRSHSTDSSVPPESWQMVTLLDSDPDDDDVSHLFVGCGEFKSATAIFTSKKDEPKHDSDGQQKQWQSVKWLEE